MKIRLYSAFALMCSIILLTGCTTAYYSALEKFGIEKRDILADRVEDARDSQEDTKEQFVDALERYRSIVNVDGGNLETVYNRLNKSFKKSEENAAEVTERINSIESVAGDLFDEWKSEINQYSDASLKSKSQQLLAGTQKDYRKMLAAMRRAESSLDPVLSLFRDQVLYLRHNLNARAIGALQSELGDIETATAAAIDEMERSIDEASQFIVSMR
ncbi:MAG: DUF2959 domain-containing protein [Gammaproteobacteria bacterium]